MDWRRVGELEFEYRALHHLCCWTDGSVGMEEGEEVSQGVWRQVQAQEVCHLAGYLVSVYRAVRDVAFGGRKGDSWWSQGH
jgi:hypothetical protein